MSELLRAPFSYFGNKRPITQHVWSRLGNVDFYSEPCFGSGAVYFARPNPTGTEIINDKESLLINAWRAITYEPEKTAELVICPPAEIEIISRHRWLMEIGKPKLEKLKADPFWCDPQIAAFYLYGMACYVGAGFCTGDSYKNQQLKIPKVSNEGIFRSELDGDIVKITDYFKAIQRRMRNTKIACGDWDRVVTPIWTTGNQSSQIAGVFLDPPYLDDQHSVSYSAGGGVAQAVRLWALENGDNPNMRICVAGYASESYRFPETWEHVSWKAGGGYANQGEGRGRENAKREMLWFSPGCLKLGLFQFMEQEESVEAADELESNDSFVETELPEIEEPESVLLKEIPSAPVVQREFTQTSLLDLFK